MVSLFSFFLFLNYSNSVRTLWDSFMRFFFFFLRQVCFHITNAEKGKIMKYWQYVLIKGMCISEMLTV